MGTGVKIFINLNWCEEMMHQKEITSGVRSLRYTLGCKKREE